MILIYFITITNYAPCYSCRFAPIHEGTNWDSLVNENPWLNTEVGLDQSAAHTMLRFSRNSLPPWKECGTMRLAIVQGREKQ